MVAFENIRMAVHSVLERISEKVPELIGGSVAGTAAIITGLSIIETIKGGLQILALIATISVSVATFIYIRKKTRNLPDHASRRNYR